MQRDGSADMTCHYFLLHLFLWHLWTLSAISLCSVNKDTKEQKTGNLSLGIIQEITSWAEVFPFIFFFLIDCSDLFIIFFTSPDFFLDVFFV